MGMQPNSFQITTFLMVCQSVIPFTVIVLLGFMEVGEAVALCLYGYTLPVCFARNYFTVSFILDELLLPAAAQLLKKWQLVF